MTPLTFADLRLANIGRSVLGRRLEYYSLPEMTIAVGGAVGDILNSVARLHGLRLRLKSRVNADQLRDRFADGLADSVIYLDLLLARAGLGPFYENAVFDTRTFDDLRAATIKDFSNSTQDRDLSLLGCQLLDGLEYLAQVSLADLGATNGQNTSTKPSGKSRALGIIDASHIFLDRLDDFGFVAGIDLGAAVVAKFNSSSEKYGLTQRLVT